MKSSKAAIVISDIIQKVQLIVGVFLAVLFGIFSFRSIVDNKRISTILIMFAFFTIGVLLIICSRKRKTLIENFKIYAPRLSADPTGSIENLALGLGTSQDVVKNNIEKMIKKGYFLDVYIDVENNRVIFNIVLEHITVTCKSCGGINKVTKGIVVECDYCGSPLS